MVLDEEALASTLLPGFTLALEALFASLRPPR
jgi:hypothetical protein